MTAVSYRVGARPVGVLVSMMKNLLTIFYTLAVLCLGPTPAHAAKYGVASGVSVT